MKRASGVLMHVSSLPGEYSSGAFGAEAKNFIDLISETGFSYWQVLPFCLPDDCNSPYKSFGAFSLNPNFIDLNTLYNKGLITKEERVSARQKSPYLCEFERLKKERVPLLKKAAERFKDGQKLAAFLKKYPEINEFAKFMALKEANDYKPFYEWTKNSYDEKSADAWRFIEYEFFIEWEDIKAYANKKGVKIIGDVPMYVDLDSVDVYSAPENFLLGENYKPDMVAGVPPDYFSKDGQKWGNPLYDWAKMEKDGYKWWKRRISFMCDLFDGVRIDHFRAFESYFAVPEKDETAKNGKWVKGAGIKFINEIKKVAKDNLIIAEDLGVITEEVVKLVEKSGFPGMRVLQFAFSGDKNSPHLPFNYKNNCVAYTGTHDNNTLLGYVWEMDDGDRRRMLKYFGYASPDWNACYDSVLRGMFASHAGLVILPVQDLLLYGADTRMNTPGVSQKNWAFRVTSEQLKTIHKQKFIEFNDLYHR